MSVGLFSEEFIETFQAIHAAGLPVGKTFLVYGAGFSFGKNFVKFMRDSARGGVAVADFIRDLIIAFIIGYVIGGSGVGGNISALADSSAIEILRAMGGGSMEWVGDTANISLGALASLGINLNVIPSFVLTMSAFLIGAFIGVVFGFLLN